MTTNLRSLLSGLFLSLAAVGVACGGSSSASNTEPANGDAAYVDSVCSAAGTMFAAYQKDFASSSAALIGMDPTDAYMKISKVPYGRLVSDLEATTPPAAIRTGHDDLLRRAKELLAALTAGDRTKVLALKGTPDTGTWKEVLDVPQQLKDLLGTVSSSRPACQALEKSGGGNPFE